MADDDKVAKRKEKILDAPDQKVCYSDLMEIKVTAEEIVLHFGLKKNVESDGAVGVAKIYLSVPHAKRVADALTNSLNAYEQLFGEIEANPENRLTPEARKALEGQTADE